MRPDGPDRARAASSPGGPTKLLAVGISDEDRAQLHRLAGSGGLDLLETGTYDEASDPYVCRPKDYIARAVAFARAQPRIDGVIGVEDFPPSLLVPAICRELGLPGLDF